MQTLPRFDQQYPIIGPAIVAVADWWRRHSAARESLTDFDACDPAERRRIAGDVGLSASELQALARRGGDAAELLPRRMAVLRLDPKKIGRTDGRVLQDLQRVCALCDSKRRCAKDLAHKPRDAVWEQYCPNSGTLGALQASYPSRQ